MSNQNIMINLMQQPFGQGICLSSVICGWLLDSLDSVPISDVSVFVLSILTFLRAGAQMAAVISGGLLMLPQPACLFRCRG
jgi:hypothetical protein